MEGTNHGPQRLSASNPWHRLLQRCDGSSGVLDDLSPGAALSLDAPMARLELTLSSEMWAALRRACDASQVSWETLIRAAWALVLWRHHREEAVCFGSIASGADPLKPWLLVVDPDQSIGAWLEQAEHAARERSQWPEIHEAELAQLWQLSLDTPVFHYVVADTSWCEAPRKPPAPVLLAAPRDASRLELLYATNRLHEAAARRLLVHWSRALHQLSGDLRRSLSSFELCDEEDWAAYRKLNASEARFDGGQTIVSLFEACVAEHADAIAVVAEAETLTYRELDRRANQLAHALVELGAAADVPIGICLERSVEMVVGLLAILKSGSAYLPLDPSYPDARLQQMLDDAQPPVVLVHGPTSGRVPSAGVRVLDLEDRECWSHHSHSAPGVSVYPRQLAYVIYTSGSTGRPKGVMNEHGAVVNRLKWAQAAIGLTPDDRVLQKTPFSFDVSVWEFFWTLMVGARLIVARPEGHKDSAYLVGVIRQHGITLIHFVPSMLQAFLLDRRAPSCQSLKHIICSGEELTAALAKECMARLPAKLHNLYGPTEAAVDVTSWTCERDGNRTFIPIGKPVANTQVYILDAHGNLCPSGVPGELHIGGVQVARGYLGKPELTREKFIPNPFGPPGTRLYKTGDLARLSPEGFIEYLGRIDFQVKLRGLRIELGEIEVALHSHPTLDRAAVILREDRKGDARLVAYLVARSTRRRPSDDELRAMLRRKLPEFMVPSAFVWLAALPLTPSGKLNRNALPPPPAQVSVNKTVEYRSQRERVLCSVLAETLGVEAVEPAGHFFDMGGNSLLAMRAVARLRDRYDLDVPIARFFQHPSARALDQYLEDRSGDARLKRRLSRSLDDASSHQADAVAVIGMAGRFPGAPSVDALWEVISQGSSTISELEAETLDRTIPRELLEDPNYVRARGIAPDYDRFDPAFFGISPREAELMDPQQRILLETAWHALEHAGYVPETIDGLVGVFAGQYSNTYLTRNILTHPEILEALGDLAVLVLNEKDYAATRIAHQLNLFGPAVSVHTACSTSLVAVVEAVFSLRAGRCDVALAGGASVTCPVRSGYLYVDGGMLSADGQTRSFDAAATGTTFNDGAAMVVLKRLSDALRDRDTIHGVIRGAATNNDGGNKASFTAPSVEGQAAVVMSAQRMAGVSARDIGYVEAHGTATPLGDPIEVEALTAAFRKDTADRGFCGLGSVKSNIGHLVCAAGVAGLIKTLYALKHGVLPPTAHFKKPNRNLRLEQTPFFVSAELRPWPREAGKRYLAGVSSFGVGGTNAHLVVEEPPRSSSLPSPRPCQLILCSGKSSTALERNVKQLSGQLCSAAGLNLADAAFTLGCGRSAFDFRCFAVGSSAQEVSERLQDARVHRTPGTQPRLAFLFPGQGAQFAGMGGAIYALDPVFRAVVDECCGQLQPLIDCDLRELLFQPDTSGFSDGQLQQTFITQPALFTIEYAIAQVLLGWGIAPCAMIGHSVGEFVCAVLAGVMSLSDALRLVAARGRLIQELPPGAMLSVRLNAEAVRELLPSELAIASVNSPTLCVVSGPLAAVAKLERTLTERDVVHRRLVTSHAFHSPMMDSAVEPFAKLVREVKLNAPRVPFVSSVTGDWIQPHQATDAHYWARHLRETVLFSQALQRLMKEEYAFIEAGPRATLTTLARQQSPSPRQLLAVPTLGDARETEATWRTLMHSLGQLWSSGVEIDWSNFYANEERYRVPLPTYAFERDVCWIDAAEATPDTARRATVNDGNGHPLSAADTTTQRLIQQQLEVIQRQMNVLRRLQGA